jgi:hypothetical protein
MLTLPPAMIAVVAPFAPLFSGRVWCYAQVLLAGANLAPAQCTSSNWPTGYSRSGMPGRRLLILGRYRCVVTAICSQYSSTGQVEQCGRRPTQTCFPNGISRRLMSTQWRWGNFPSSVAMVCSGVLVAT